MINIPPITSVEAVAALLFALAVVHTFSTRYFEHRARTQTAHAGVWHLMGEVETVFGFWALLLLVFMAFAQGWSQLPTTWIHVNSSSRCLCSPSW